MDLFPLGIDISKSKFDVALLLEDGRLHHRVFTNNASGFEQLSAWLSKRHLQHVHACLEATGTYGEALAIYLHNAGHIVSVVNPSVIKAFASTEMSRTKTDKTDSSLIARYCLKHQPPAWAPPAPEISELQALLRRLDALLDMRQQETNRQAAGLQAESVKKSVTDHINYLDSQIAHTQSLIHDHIDQNPSLKQQRDLLSTIPGIGDLTAAKLLSEFVDINKYSSARQAAAFAGLVPRHNDSGSSVRGSAKWGRRGCERLCTSRP